MADDEDGPPPPRPRKGMLPTPKFERPPPGRYRPPARKSPWQAHFELLRKEENWGHWAIVSEHIKGGKKATNKAILNDRKNIETWLDRNCPLELWEFRTSTVSDTWCHRQLRIRFMGYMTMEEATQRATNRRRAQEARLELIATRKAERALAARQAALAEQEANRARGRTRG